MVSTRTPLGRPPRRARRPYIDTSGDGGTTKEQIYEARLDHDYHGPPRIRANRVAYEQLGERVICHPSPVIWNECTTHRLGQGPGEPPGSWIVGRVDGRDVFVAQGADGTERTGGVGSSRYEHDERGIHGKRCGGIHPALRRYRATYAGKQSDNHEAD